jgi:hypothetical protein
MSCPVRVLFLTCPCSFIVLFLSFPCHCLVMSLSCPFSMPVVLSLYRPCPSLSLSSPCPVPFLSLSHLSPYLVPDLSPVLSLSSTKICCVLYPLSLFVAQILSPCPVDCDHMLPHHCPLFVCHGHYTLFDKFAIIFATLTDFYFLQGLFIQVNSQECVWLRKRTLFGIKKNKNIYKYKKLSFRIVLC